MTTGHLLCIAGPVAMRIDAVFPDADKWRPQVIVVEIGCVLVSYSDVELTFSLYDLLAFSVGLSLPTVLAVRCC